MEYATADTFNFKQEIISVIFLSSLSQSEDDNDLEDADPAETEFDDEEGVSTQFKV